MRNAYFLSICLLISCQVNAEVNTSENYKYYSINPVSRADMLASLRAASPIREGDEIFLGHTHSAITWNFRWNSNSNSCWITSVETKIASTYTLPQLASDAIEVKQVWSRWFPKLLRHENGHHDIALKTARKIDAGIANMVPQPNCQVLEKLANELGKKYLEEMGVQNKKYDQDTNHGETEGARLSTYL